MQDFQVPWGDDTFRVSIPDDWPMLQQASPSLKPASPDWPQHLAEALNNPGTGPKLAELLRGLGSEGRLSILVEDATRHSPTDRILEVVLREVRHAGIAEEQMEIVIAGGMHPPLSAEEAAAKLGPAAKGIAWRCNPWDEFEEYDHLGRVGKVDIRIDRRVVRSDLRILISSVSPHLQAGFGGGAKMLLPGCGELASIRHMHRTGLSRKGTRQMVGLEPGRNAMRSVIDQAGQFVDQTHGRTFSVQYLQDGEDQPVDIAAGELIPTHRMLVKKCAVACGIVPEGQADILITNAHPRDHDLWQCFKCIPNTCWGARPGGVVICLARCPQGLNEMKTMSWPLSPAMTRRVVRFLGPETICSLMDRIVKQLAGDSQWFIRLATQMLERNHLLMVSPHLVEQGVQFPGIGMYYSLGDALAQAEKLLGAGPHRVSLYREGGISYPIIPQAGPRSNGH